MSGGRWGGKNNNVQIESNNDSEVKKEKIRKPMKRM